MVAPGRTVEAGGSCFGPHRLRWLIQGEQHTDSSFFTLDNPSKIANIRRVKLARFDGQNDLSRVARAIVEIDSAVDTVVRTLSLLGWTRADQPERPPLKLIRVGVRQRFGVGERHGLADDSITL